MKKMGLASLAVTLISLLSAQQTAIQDPLVGTWRVVTLKATSEGKVSYPVGDPVAGLRRHHWIWLLFVDSTRKPQPHRR
jgi:hypothetical protein